MSLKIYLLGQFKLQTNGSLIELPSRPAQSILAYLALNVGVTHRREKLASLVWPDASESNARSYLRQALWRIRKSLESESLNWEDYLQISDISLTFNEQSDYWLDAERLLEPVEGRPVQEIIEVVGLYRDELLPGFYDEWVVVERDRLQAAYHKRMNLVLERLVHNGQWDEVLEWSEQWIRLGHAPEPAYRALMNAYGGLGDQSMVSETYQRCVEALDRELVLEPSLETRELYERILHGELDETLSTTPIVADLAYQSPAFLEEGGAQQVEKVHFVVRESELGRLDHFLNLSLDNQGRVVFVTGEAGSGKTALVNEFIQRAQDTHADLVVASGNCNAHTGIGDPYLPFREVMELLTGDVEARWSAGAITREHARRLWNTLPVTAQALVECGPSLINTFVQGAALVERAFACTPAGTDWLVRLTEFMESKTAGSVGPGLQQSDLFEQYTRVLGALARKVPLVLVVDDLQWADAGSVGLMFHLGRHLAGSRILIVGAYRPEEVAIGREGERHPLASVFNELQREFGDILINVDRAEGRNFVDAILDSEPNRLEVPFREMLQRQAHGQPLFTIELLRGMRDRGDLVQDQEGRWIEGSSLDWERLPARVEAVIAERIGRLAHPLRAVLRVASVEGEVFTAEVVARVQNADKRELLTHLSGDLNRRHRIIRTQSIQRIEGQFLSTYRFRHILFQKYLYSSMDEVERVHLHEQIGTVLEDLYGVQEQSAVLADIAPQLARHFQEAKNFKKAIHYLHQAGERAVQLSAYQEGIAHLSEALGLLMTLPDSPERAQQELALQVSLGMAWIGTRGFPAPEVKEAITRARQLGQQMGKIDQLCQVIGELSVFHYVGSEHQKARELAKEAISLAQQVENPMLIALGYWYLGCIMFCMGKFKIAQNHFKKIITIYEPEEHHLTLVHLRGSDFGLSAIAYDACCLWCLGYPDQANKRSKQVLALAREYGHPYTLADVLSIVGCLFYAMRRDATALMDNAEELMHLSDEKVKGWRGTGTMYRGEALGLLGQFQEGIVEMRQGMVVRQSYGARCYASGTLGSLAMAHAKAGQPEEGLNTMAEALAMVEETEERHWEAELYRQRAEILLMLGDDTQAEASLKKAIEVAQRQNAKSWELRATTDLARLRQKQDRKDETKKMLGEIYSWFTEGFGTRDLSEAKALMDEIS